MEKLGDLVGSRLMSDQHIRHVTQRTLRALNILLNSDDFGSPESFILLYCLSLSTPKLFGALIVHVSLSQVLARKLISNLIDIFLLYLSWNGYNDLYRLINRLTDVPSVVECRSLVYPI